MIGPTLLLGVSLLLHGQAVAAMTIAADDPPAGNAPADPADELAKAKARIAELEAEVAALKARLAASPSAPVPPTPVQPSAPTGEARFASPASIFRTMSDEYTRSLAELLPAPGDSAETAIFRRELERWVASVNRSYRHPVRWSGRLVRLEPKGDGMVATMEPIDAATGETLGEAYSVPLEARVARRVAAAARGQPQGETWVLTGTFVPEVRFQPGRMQRGDFDNPPLLGPGAEFLWRLEVGSLVPGRREKPAESETPAVPSP